MGKLITAGWLTIAIFSLAACSQDNDTTTNTHGRAEEIVKSISNDEGEVDLVLTTESVYLQLSEETLAEIKAEFDDERAEEEDNALASTIKNVVLNNVERFLEKRIEYPIEEVEAIYWDDGEIVIEVEDENLISFDDIDGDDGNVMETFAEDDALEFIEAYEKIRDDS